MNQKCKLCNQEKEIVQSHIVPKFVVRFLKETGPGFFRTFENPNIKHQDIAKLPLLCRDCEVMLSREEDYFNREIFHPLLKDQWTSISYSESLYFFLISVLWRNLVSKFEEYKKGLKHFREILARTERAWRIYLSNRENDPQTDVHLFITDILTDSIPVRRFNSYLTRAVDITIASSQKDCFVYTKFARFCIFAPLTNYDHTLWVNTKVMNGKGILSGPQQIRDGRIGEFLVSRVRLLMTEYNKNISDRQNEKIRQHQKQILPKIIDSDFLNALLADSTSKIDPGFFPDGKIGRNEPCPCGSGKKYKKCCITRDIS